MFRAVACTSAANARNNTGTTGTGVPIYWLGGNKAADSYTDFYDGSWDEEVTVRNESGTSVSIGATVTAGKVWTGCEADGTQGEHDLTSTSLVLGASRPGYGHLNNSGTDFGPMNSDDGSDLKSDQRNLYGLSPVFVVTENPQNGVEVPADWSLIPSGLSTGDEFRLIFHSSTKRGAASTDIDVYNDFVQDLANGGHTSIQEHAYLFRAVACTSAANARNNTGTTGTGVPIYWLGGNKAADSYTDFYDGSWDEEVTVRNESGTSVSIGATVTAGKVWTGCEADGTQGEHDLTSTSLVLGASRPGYGHLNNSGTDFGPMNSDDGSDLKSDQRNLYGLSPVFVVEETTVPDVTVSFEHATYSVQEGSSVTIDVELSEDPKRTVSITIGATADTTASADDFSFTPSAVTFNSGETEKSVTLTAAQDTVDDDDETVVLAMLFIQTGVTLGTNGQTTVTITDDDDPVEDTTVDLDTSVTHTVSQHRHFVSNTGSGNNDNNYGLGQYTIPRRAQAFTTGIAGGGYIVSSVGIRFSNIGPIASAGNHLEVTLNERAPNGNPSNALCTLQDPENFDDHAVNVFIAPTTGDNSCPSLQPNTTYYVVVKRVAGTGDIKPTHTSRDGEDAEHTSRGWSIANDSRYFLAGTSTWATRSQVLKTDIDGDYVPSLTAIDANADESGDPDVSTTMTFQIFLDHRLKHEVSVDYATQDGTATAGVNYTHTSGTVTFAPREQVKTVDVEILEDDRGGSTYFMLILSNQRGAGLRYNSPGTGRILDTSPRFRSWDSTGRESNNGTDSTMSFWVEFDHRPHGDTTDYTVDYRTEAITATADSDYESVSGTLTWAPGDGDKIVDVTVKDDDVQDNGETFRIVLSNPSKGAQLHRTAATAIGTILNQDSEGLTATFPASAYASKSHKGPTDRPQVVVAFNSAVASISKTTPSVQVNGASITSVQAHTEDGLQNAQIFILEPDGNDDITFTLVANIACDSGGICNQSGTPLTQVPSAHTVPAKESTAESSQLSVADATASEEDDSTINFVVKLSPASDETVSVNYATSDGTATAGDDYTAKSGTLTFNAGETTKTVQVSVIDDSTDDNSETLTLTLSSPSGAEISDAQATGTITNVEPTPDPLTAALTNIPDSHDGSTAFTFRVLFSEDVGISYVNMRDDAFSLSEGDVTGARRVDGRNDLWELTVEPDDNSDVGITLPANRSCTTTGAICTREDSPRQLTNSPTATVTGPAEAPPTNTSAAGAPTISGTPQVEQTLTADTSSITDEDGLTNVSYSYQWIAGGSDIGGATGSTYTLTSSEQGQTVQVRVTFTDDADNEETLTSAATVEVTAAPVPLTVSVTVSAPATHDGSSEFTFEIEFSEEFGISYATLRDHAFNVTGGSVERAQRTDKPINIAWLITVKPQGNGDVTIELPATTDCNADGAICTGDGRKLSNSLSFTVSGPGQ